MDGAAVYSFALRAFGAPAGGASLSVAISLSPVRSGGGGLCWRPVSPRKNRQRATAMVGASKPALARSRSARSEERRVGKECVRTGTSRWSPYNQKKKHQRRKTTNKTRT